MVRVTVSLCRLERNQEREQGVSNMEYLKNVVLKVCKQGPVLGMALHQDLVSVSFQFLYTVGPEQASLIPIITKLLQLSPQEVKFLQETIKGNLPCSRLLYTQACVFQVLATPGYKSVNQVTQSEMKLLQFDWLT